MYINYELYRTNEVVASGVSGGYGRGSMGERIFYMYGKLVYAETVIKRETGFTASLSLNQLTDKFYENLLSCAKVQNIFVPCKFFFKKACRRRLG